MGKQALRSHMEGKKHSNVIKCRQLSSSLSNFLKREKSNCEVTQILNSVEVSYTTNTTCPSATKIITDAVTYASSSTKDISPSCETSSLKKAGCLNIFPLMV